MVLFDCSNNTGATDVKMDGPVLEEKPSFKMLGLSFSCKLDFHSYIVSIAKTASKKHRASIRSMTFLPAGVALYSTNLPYSLPWNTVVMFWVVFLAAAWKFVKLKNQICRADGPSLAAFLEPLTHCKNVSGLSLLF